MAQSNPIFEYHQAIISNQVVVPKGVKKEVSRVIELLETGYIYYVSEKVDIYLNYIQNELYYSDFSGEHFVLTLWQRYFIACVYGVKFKTEVTKLNKQTGLKEKIEEEQMFFRKFFLQMGKKSGKTELIAVLSIIELMREENKFQSYYLMAENEKQAKILWKAMAMIIEQSPHKKFFKVNKKPATIEHTETHNIIEIAISDGLKLQGTKMKTAIVDEVHVLKENIEPTIDNSTKSVKDSKAIYITTAGLVRDGMYDDFADALKRWRKNPHSRTLQMIYKLDEISELSDRNKWQKALPNIGVTYPEESMLDQVEEARYNPVSKRELLAYFFGLPQSANMSFFEAEHVKLQDLDRNVFVENYCVIGVDLATADDFASASIVTYDKYKFHVHTITIKPAQKSKVMATYKENEYNKFVEREELIVSPSAEIDIMDLAKEVEKFILENDLIIHGLAYDRYYAQEFVSYFKNKYAPRLHPVIQGHRTMAEPLRVLTRDLVKERIVFDNSLLRNAFLSVVTRADANGNLIPSKKNSGGNKIDPFAGFFNAYIFITTILMEEMPVTYPREEER